MGAIFFAYSSGTP